MSRHLAPLCVAIAFAVGVAAATSLDALAIATVTTRWLVALALGAAALRRPRWFVLPAAVALGLARGAAPVTEQLARGLDDHHVDRASGVVAGPVVDTARGHGALLVADDGTRVWIWTAEPLVPGERISVLGSFRSPRAAPGFAQPARADLLRARGADLEVTAQRIERHGATPDLGDRVWRWAHATQGVWATRIGNAAPTVEPAARAALAGIVVGARGDIPPALDQRWRAIGIYHVLSVSGLHLAIVAGLVFWLLCRVVASSPWGGRCVPARWAAPPALVVAAAYTLITGGQIATLRALVVIAIVLVAAMLARPIRLVDALAIAALVLLAWRPAELFDAGFQLSFAATLVLAVTPSPGEHRGIRGWIARGLAASLWIAIVTAPITAFHFQQVLPSGIVGNLLLGPPLELVALPLALAGLVVGWDAPIAIASHLVELVDLAAATLEPLALVGRVAVAEPLLLVALLAIAIALAARAGRRTRLDLALWIALCAGWAFGRVPAAAGALRVTFVDVGQGDAAIVELPDGAVWLVDAGGHASARDSRAASAPGRAVERTLAAYGHARIDVAVISHPHPDHYLGLVGMTLPIGELWIARESESSAEVTSFGAIVAALAARGTRVVHVGLGAIHAAAGVDVVSWWPRYRSTTTSGESLAADPVRSVNDNSLVFELRYRGRSILFTGDLELEGEHAVAALADLRTVDVVKVPHHGSRTSSSEAFVARTRPRFAVISCGVANQFGFPHAEVEARWQAVGAEVLRTDRHGAITIVVDEDGALDVKTALPRGRYR